MSTSTPTIHIQVRNIYGNPSFYPACPQAELFARIAGTKTLTRRILTYIKQLGYEIVQHHEEATL